MLSLAGTLAIFRKVIPFINDPILRLMEIMSRDEKSQEINIS